MEDGKKQGARKRGEEEKRSREPLSGQWQRRREEETHISARAPMWQQAYMHAHCMNTNMQTQTILATQKAWARRIKEYE